MALNQILPTDLQYYADSSEYRVNPPDPDDPNSAPWLGLGNTEPTGAGVSSNPYIWSYANYPALFDVLTPSDVVQIRFDAYVGCLFVGGNLEFYAEYEECGTIGSASTRKSVFPVRPHQPDVTVVKSPGDQEIVCGTEAEWTITVSNDGNAAEAQYVWDAGTISAAPLMKALSQLLVPTAPRRLR